MDIKDYTLHFQQGKPYMSNSMELYKTNYQGYAAIEEVVCELHLSIILPENISYFRDWQ